MTGPDGADPGGGHSRTQAAFSAYVDGELAAEERAQVEQHLGACIQCRTELTRFRATVQRLGTLRAQAPGTFLADIQQQIHRRSRGRFFGGRGRWRLFGRLPFEWVSLAMILAMLVYYILSQQSAPTDVVPR